MNNILKCLINESRQEGISNDFKMLHNSFADNKDIIPFFLIML